MLRQDLIQQLNDARIKLDTALENIDPQTELNPGLMVKDMLAHISAWDEVCVDSLRIHAGGEEHVEEIESILR
ncbi:MAG: hypothetical protein ISR58_01940 [Anaerolineales bacterium]|nr:hypothetical protein [Chloroflexota bacterium]MBL6979928.1 hypothetical protein [Anaerolineales bacterium]